MTVVVTGATGFVGSVVAARLAARGEDVAALVRAPDPAAAQARLDAATGGGVTALPGDLLGDLPALPHDTTAIVHCAASVSFALPLAEARAINVDGTRRLLAAAARLPVLERVVHVSTAYVAGTHSGAFGEGDLDVGQDFRNTYERSKHEAETAVRASEMPVTVVRPSIVVGDSQTGWTSAFNVLYHPIRAFARGLVEEVPADPEGVLDVVPVDHVADVVDAALEGAGPVLHAVAAEEAVTTAELARLASAAFDRPPPRFVAPATGPAGPSAESLAAYHPYFAVAARFRADRARTLGLAPPPLADYFDVLMGYARATGWGRRPRSRAGPRQRRHAPAVR